MCTTVHASTTLNAPSAVIPATAAPVSADARCRTKPTPARLATEATNTIRSLATRDSSARMAIVRVRSASAQRISCRVRPTNVAAPLHHARSRLTSQARRRPPTTATTAATTTAAISRRRAASIMSLRRRPSGSRAASAVMARTVSHAGPIQLAEPAPAGSGRPRGIGCAVGAGRTTLCSCSAITPRRALRVGPPRCSDLQLAPQLDAAWFGSTLGGIEVTRCAFCGRSSRPMANLYTHVAVVEGPAGAISTCRCSTSRTSASGAVNGSFPRCRPRRLTDVEPL